jgi:hypothetical protein
MDEQENDELLQWGHMESGLRLGLRATKPIAGGGVDVVAAVENKSDQPHFFGGDFSLQIDGQPDIMSGPRSGEPIPIIPGETLEFASWRLDEETLGPGGHVVVVVYEPEGGHPIASGKVEVSIEDDPHRPFVGSPA